MRQIKPKDGVPRLQARQHDGRVRRAPEWVARLPIQPRTTHTNDRWPTAPLGPQSQPHSSACANSLCVLVGQDAALGGYHRFAGVVFRGDELRTFELANPFTFDNGCDFGILKGHQGPQQRREQ